METVKHTHGPTAGPWEVKPNYNSMRNAVFAGKQRIAVVGESSLTDGDPDANAHLIAAAPDLLDACREALGQMPDTKSGIYVYDDLLDAIAKAEGK